MSFLKNLFKEAGVKDVVTLFHSPSSKASMRVHASLKQMLASQHAHATEDQASSHSSAPKTQDPEIQLDVEENAPTVDQLASILEYLGPSKAGTVVQGAQGTTDALRKFKENSGTFQTPVVVDWHLGKAVAGDDESEILKLIRDRPAKS